MLMRAYVMQVSAKVIIRSEIDVDDLAANLYSQISEFIHSEEDLMDMELELFPLPDNLSGSSDRRHGTDTEEGGEAALA
jgi:hypothetical protein